MRRLMTWLYALQAQVRAGMVADNPRLREALQRTSNSSNNFASDTDSRETNSKIANLSVIAALSCE